MIIYQLTVGSLKEIYLLQLKNYYSSSKEAYYCLVLKYSNIYFEMYTYVFVNVRLRLWIHRCLADIVRTVIGTTATAVTATFPWYVIFQNKTFNVESQDITKVYKN